MSGADYDGLKAILRKGSKLLDEKANVIGYGLSQIALAAFGYEKKELRKLVKDGVLLRQRARDANTGSIMNFYYLPEVGDAEKASS